MSTEIEVKQIGGHVLEVKQETRNDVPVGLITGHIATFDIDRGNDQFQKGAFLESIADHKKKGRQLRFKDHHYRTVGGFPIETVSEDAKGLIGTAEVNLEVQQGRELFSLAKQGVLVDFSIGFSSLDDEQKDGIRIIKKAIVWEGSLVDEPMNINANVIEVKAIAPFQDLPMAPREYEWNAEEAKARVLEFSGSDSTPGDAYRSAFLVSDVKDSVKFDEYKIQIADVIKGRLTIVPQAVFEAASMLSGDGVKLSEQGMAKAVAHIERYYAKMDIDSPFQDDDKQFFIVDDVKNMGPKELEKALRKSGILSRDAAALIVTRFHGAPAVDEKLYTLAQAKILIDLKSMKTRL